MDFTVPLTPNASIWMRYPPPLPPPPLPISQTAYELSFEDQGGQGGGDFSYGNLVPEVSSNGDGTDTLTLLLPQSQPAYRNDVSGYDHGARSFFTPPITGRDTTPELSPARAWQRLRDHQRSADRPLPAMKPPSAPPMPR